MSGFLSSASITRLRRRADAGRTATCAVQEKTSVHVGGGVYEQQWTTIPGREAERVSYRPAAMPREFVAADAVRAVARYEVRFTAGAVVESTHRLILTPDPDEAPDDPVLTLAVIGPLRRTVEISRRVLCEVIPA